MIAIAVELLLSWLLLKYSFGENLNALGFHLNTKRLLLMLYGFVLPLVYLSALYLGISLWVQNPYQLNPDYTAGNFIKSVFYVLKAVVFEELIFRGALLYLLLKKLGSRKAILTSALAFGVYHWFSYNLFGQPVQMLTVLISTGAMGYLLALAFVKTNSIQLPFALHLGYNITSMILFSKEKNIGLQLFIKTYTVDPVKPDGILPLLIVVIYYIGFPLLGFTCLKLLRDVATD